MAVQEASIMKTVAQLLRTKGHEILSVSPEISVFDLEGSWPRRT